MKTPVVRELKPDEITTAVFLVQTKEIRQKRTGEPYLSLTLSDRSGEIEARMWDNVAEVMDTFERDHFIKVRGQLQIYNTRPQFIIHKLRHLPDAEVNFADFFPASARNPDEMWAELRQIVAEVPNLDIRELLDSFLDDPDIAARYRVAPAAKSIHHAFRAGLLEHVLSLCGLARPISAHYGTVDWSLMVAGIVLHDIGKIYELTYERGFAYSTQGQLIGHIPIAMRMLYDKLRAFPEFPEKLRTLVEHMILSHHGKLEFGSPKIPLFPEALLLHYLDDMDSKMECMRATAEKGALAEGLFTAWSSPLERVVLRKERYLTEGAAPCEPETSAQPEPEPALSGVGGGLAINYGPRWEATGIPEQKGTTRMAKDRELPPPLEMACLNALWELGEGNVEEVRVCVSRARPLAYTTVLTLLDRLSRRGAVSRRKEGRGFRYQPAIDRDRLRRLALTQFLDHHFGGSTDVLRDFLDSAPVAETGSEQVAMAVAAGSESGGSADIGEGAVFAGEAAGHNS